MLRPGIVQPLRCVRSSTPLYNALYVVLGPLVPVMRRLLPNRTTTSVNFGRAMIRLAIAGDSKRIISNADINRLATYQ
jgi:hypothetical protein